MTLFYNSTTSELSITSTNITTYLGDTVRYDIDIQIDDTSITTAPTVNPHVATVTKDVLLDVKVILTDDNDDSITTDQGCVLTDNTLYCSAVKAAEDSEKIEVLLDYYLLSRANECACECTKLKELFSNFSDKIEDCEC